MLSHILTKQPSDSVPELGASGLAGKDWFHGTLGNENVVRLLHNRQPGSYLVSISDERRV